MYERAYSDHLQIHDPDLEENPKARSCRRWRPIIMTSGLLPSFLHIYNTFLVAFLITFFHFFFFMVTVTLLIHVFYEPLLWSRSLFPSSFLPSSWPLVLPLPVENSRPVCLLCQWPPFALKYLGERRKSSVTSNKMWYIHTTNTLGDQL